jgi:hypothetical protein
VKHFQHACGVKHNKNPLDIDMTKTHPFIIHRLFHTPQIFSAIDKWNPFKMSVASNKEMLVHFINVNYHGAL